MAAAGVGQLAFIDGEMNAAMYCDILKNKMSSKNEQVTTEE